MQIPKTVMLSTEKIIVDNSNPNTMSDKAFASLKRNIERYGFLIPVITNKEYKIADGYHRWKAGRELGLTEIPVIALEIDEVDRRMLRQILNKLKGEHDGHLDAVEYQFILEQGQGDLFEELSTIGIDEINQCIAEVNPVDVVEDEFVPDLEKPPTYLVNKGDVYTLGNHRLMCGDSTVKEDVDTLMDENKADMVFTDPPYGMKKENEGVLNDNLNYDDLLEFNKQWIKLSFDCLQEVGSWYCWGTDEPLMDVYSNILKPMKKNNEITFRNLITWDKNNGQGQMAEEFRMFPIADEKCLFAMCGVQGFNNNADNYFEGWESIRDYLLVERKKAGWDIPTMKRVAGHSDLSRDHWTSKSQWNMPTQKVYSAFQSWCLENNVDAFKKEYEELKKEYEELKKEYYSTRAYFNNTHDNMNNVWHFGREINREHNHATPKPIELCSRAIKSSSRENELVLDLFGGSGSTLIACEQLNRSCYMMELDLKYCSVIIERWEKLTGNKAERVEHGE